MNPEYYRASPTRGNIEAAAAATEAGLEHGMSCRDTMAAMDKISTGAIPQPWRLTVELDCGELVSTGQGA